MHRIIPTALLVLTLSGGAALADHGRGRGSSHRQGGTFVAPTHRHDRGVDRRYDRRVDRRVDRRYDRRHDRRYDRRHDRRVDNRRHVHVQRTRPVFRNNRFVFAGGFSRPYTRPVFNVRYRNRYRRPALIVENYEPVPGYVWVAGRWQWNRYEWIWTPGRYEVDASYQEPYYGGDAYLDDDGYYDGGVRIQGNVSGSWSF